MRVHRQAQQYISSSRDTDMNASRWHWEAPREGTIRQIRRSERADLGLRVRSVPAADFEHCPLDLELTTRPADFADYDFATCARKRHPKTW